MTHPRPQPPQAEERSHSATLHGITREDPYAWLRDDNWQDVMRDPAVLDADIRRYLEAENAYWAAVMAPEAGAVEKLFEEMKGRIKEDDSSVPLPDGPFAYYRRYREGGQHPVFCRRPRDGGEEQILLDGDAEAEGLSYFRVAALEHTPDHGRLAVATDTNGSEIYTLRFREAATGEILPDVIENAHGACEWANDGETLFYTVLDDNHRPSAVLRHRLGTDPAHDVEVYREADAGFFVSLSKTESRRHIVIHAHDHTTSELHLISADDPAAAPRLVAPREDGHEYDLTEFDGEFLVRTNEDGAEDFKVMTAPLDAPERIHWRDLVPYEAGRLILGVLAFKEYWVRLERVDGLPRLVVTARGGESHDIAFDEEAYSLGFGGSYEYDTPILRFIYSSMTTPEQTFDYHMGERTRELMKQQDVPSGHDPADYVTRRVLAPAEDGEQVPVSLLYRADTPLDGTAPLLLYGYGSYGHAIPAAFGTARLSLVDRGVVFAIAHIRGGMERGYRWYTGGRGAHKENTFTDFIAAAAHLIDQKFTAPGRIAAQGGSAGGMLMGAVVNMRPDLFGAIVAQVPFVDVLNTMCDAELPLTPPEWPEWGNPIEDPEAYGVIAGYSPYDNVSAQAYPAIYVTAGLTDPRVTYWEPAKWVARLRAMKTDTLPLVLKTNMDAGHGGAAGRFDSLKETAEAYAFVLRVLGLADRASP